MSTPTSDTEADERRAGPRRVKCEMCPTTEEFGCDACNELSAALGWPAGISGGPMQWSDLLRLVAELRRQIKTDEPHEL